jgi:hypothetical protein
VDKSDIADVWGYTLVTSSEPATSTSKFEAACASETSASLPCIETLGEWEIISLQSQEILCTGDRSFGGSL